ncbi:hypothetical protein B0H21DRAFT_742754 [Amylocystis lapponica]|nr:hypothetical protein B0H21DRAFT_742754 [Amylocystis lapponica]
MCEGEWACGLVFYMLSVEADVDVMHGSAAPVPGSTVTGSPGLHRNMDSPDTGGQTETTYYYGQGQIKRVWRKGNVLHWMTLIAFYIIAS